MAVDHHATLSDLGWAALVLLAIALIVLERRIALRDQRRHEDDDDHRDAVKIVKHNSSPPYLGDVPSPLHQQYSAAEARAWRDVLLEESGEAKREMDRHQQAIASGAARPLIPGTAQQRRALEHVYAEVSSCRARRTRMWADNLLLVAEELEEAEERAKVDGTGNVTPENPAEGKADG